MARPTKSSLPILTALLLAAAWGCTTKKQEAPPLTGPSELGTSLSITVSPDVLRQDGASQSLVTVTARDNAGQPARNLALRAEITVGGIITDFGSLSARNIVTDASGRATFIYTAPPAGPIAVDTGTIVGITVSPMGTDFGNATSKTVDIRLVPSGIIAAPPSALRLTLNLPSAVVGDTAVFTANVTDAAGNDASASVASYQWTFGDGRTASGRTVSHTYSQPGNYPVTLTIVDVLGRVGTTAQSLTVGAGTNPTATFFVTPSSPNVGQTVTFNASTSVAAPGHSITSYEWDFGDGRTAGGATVTHAYTAPGSYTVLLRTTDSAGRKGTSTQTINVGAAGLTADFNFSPTSPAVGQAVSFDGTPSKASTGRTITRYDWNFDDGTTGSGAQTSHTYSRTGTFNVRLTVTDDLGQTATTTKSVTVGGANPQAAFTFSPSSPRRGQAVSFDASSSRAASGRSIAQYAWNFDDGSIAFGVTTQHAFNSNGTFNVRLTITDDIGQTSTVTQPVTVSDANPTASFTFSPSAPATNQPVTFDASTSSPSTGRAIVAYQWNFDDGTTGTGRTVQHSFATARSYNVRLTVTDDFGNTATTSQTVTVTTGTTPPPPTADFTFQPSAPTTNQLVQFDASTSRAAQGRTITSYAWIFDDGTTGSGVTVSHAFAQARTYVVRLTVTDDAGQTNSTTRSVTVTAGGTTPTASFTYSPNSPVPPNVNITFDASQSQATAPSTISRYQWQFDGTPDPASGSCTESRAAGPVVTETQPRIVRSYSTTGTRCVVLTVFDSQGGSKQAARLITIQ